MDDTVTDEKESMDFEVTGKLVIDTGDDATENSQSDSDAKNEMCDPSTVPRTSSPSLSSNDLGPVLSPAVAADDAVELEMGNRGHDGSVSSDSLSMSGAMVSLDSSGLQMPNSGASSPASSVRNSVSKSRRKSDRILPLSSDDGNETFICPVCSEMLPSNHDLTKHIRSHNNATAAVSPSINTCTICQKVLSSQSSLDRHMLVHSGERPFECSLCKTAFTTNGNMHRHMRIHDKEHMASSENADSPGALSSQNRTPRGGKKRPGFDLGTDDSSECVLSVTPSAKRKVPSYDFSSFHNPAAKRIMFDGDLGENSNETGLKVINNFVENAGNVNGSGLICPVCNQKFISLYGLSYHLETLHGTQSKVSLVFPCLSCKLQFRGLEKLTSHMLLVHQRNNVTVETQLVEGGLNPDGDNFASSETPKKLSSRATASSAGFYASLNEILPVVDFSCEKFSLVKQLLTERSPGRKIHKTSAQLTPSRSGEDAKKSRHQTHSCVNCEQLFTSRALCAEHVLQFHNSSTIMTEFSRHAVHSDPRNEDVSGEEFALLLGLKVSADRPISLPEVPLNKFAVVDANRNLIKAEPSTISVLNPQTAPYLLGLVALAGAVPHIIPCSLPGVLNLPQQLSLFTVNKQMNLQAAAPESSPLLAAASLGVSSLAIAEVATPALSNGDVSESPTSESDRTAAGKLDDSVALDQTNTSSGHLSVTTVEESSPNDSDNNELKADTSDKDSSNNGGSYRCSVCDDSFISYRAYRGHMVSVHLGASPYKCTQCAYASPDRSTLIRHLRTHNGERPFQCLICDFAFTTKANCERHVRKKHGLDSKPDMERSIGFSRCSKELPLASDADAGGLPTAAAAASSTVCKYCGEDFKFYRTLKHHLRSQSSCAHKPFMCRTCSVGFSTRPNCLRHIQKRHGPLGAGVTAESLISVNEALLMAQQCGSKAQPAAPQCSTLANATPEPVVSQPIHPSFLGIMAGIRPRFDGVVPAAHSKPIFNVKLEDVAIDATIGDDQPLDFSVKSSASVLRPYPTAASVVTSASPAPADRDEPMDLTTRPRPFAAVLLAGAAATASLVEATASPISFVVASKSSSPSTQSSSLSSAVINSSLVRRSVTGTGPGGSHEAKCWQCPYCCTMFKNSFKLMVHMRTHGTDSVHRCQHCLAEFFLKSDLDWHVKTTHPQFADTNNNSSATPNKSSQLLDAVQRIDNSNIEQNNNIPEAVNANLSPVAKVSTSSAQQNIINKTTVVTPFVNAVLEPFVAHLANVSSAAHLGALLHPGLIASFAGASEDAGKVMGMGPDAQQEDEESVDKTQEMEKSMDAKLKAVSEMGFGGDESIKKKRNSYADSPHKLRCPYCPRAFPWISSLKRHILTHTGQKPFRCPQCPVTFSTKSNRERHMIRKHGLDVHDPATRQMMDRPYKCHLCIFSSFATSGKLVRHYKTKHSDRDLPEGMLESMPNMSHEELNAALLQLGATTSADNPNGALNLTNDPCDSDDTQNFDMDDSDDDDDSLMNDSLERAAEAVVDAVVRTIVRVPTSSSSSSVLEALPNIASVPNRSEGASSSGANGLSQVSQSRTAAGINPERDNYNVDRITECWQCNRVFDCRKSLLRHLKEHGVDLPFKCYLCDASFGARVASLTHKASAHDTDWAILRDKNRVGEDIADFSEFVDRVVEEALAGGTVAPVTARRTRDGIELDVRLESDYAQRKVFCSLCPKRFWSLQDLRRHMRSHTGERPFECDVCHARFTLKHSMMRHRRKHEGNNGDIHSDSEEESLREANGENLTTDTALPDLVQSMPIASSAAPSNNTPSFSSSAPTSSTSAANVDGPSDLLQSLLGVSDAATIEHMLDSAVNGVAANSQRHQQAPVQHIELVTASGAV